MDSGSDRKPRTADPRIEEQQYCGTFGPQKTILTGDIHE